MKDAKELVVALAGNPNCGKTSVFNNLTGSRQHVGNWPGVTVERKEGTHIHGDVALKIIDLPGTYSLGAYSEDEAVARDYLLFGQPDVIVNIVDSTNLARNLYLTTQLLETGIPVVIALKMCDELASKGIKINVPLLSQLLGVPVVQTVASRGRGMEELVEKTIAAAGNPPAKSINYGPDLEPDLEAFVEELKELKTHLNPRFLALKLLEDTEFVKDIPLEESEKEKLLAIQEKNLERMRKKWGDGVETLLAERRYGYIAGMVKEAVQEESSLLARLSVSDKIDRIVTSRLFGIPFFLLVVWGIFQFTFTLGDPLVELLEGFFESFAEAAGIWLQNIGASELVSSFIGDGIIGGIGSILVFIPHIGLLFLAISILEDSGYMARAAYIMDRFMHMLGLHGKSFLPLLVGFGCNVPGIMATRTLENKNDRLITILINPLMSCGGRLPIYILFTSALFTANQGLVIFSLILLGIVLAILMGMLFKKFLFKGDSAPFVMELPPYRLPTFKNTLLTLWDRAGAFIKRAGTVIFAASILIWCLANLPVGVEYASQQSLLGRIGSLLAPILKPAGFGNWQAASALIFGVVAKEVVVSTLGVIHGVGEEGLVGVIAKTWTPLAAYSFMVMNLLYIPCVATIGAIRRETNSWKWTLFAIGYSLALGWGVAALIYQVGSLLGFA